MDMESYIVLSELEKEIEEKEMKTPIFRGTCKSGKIIPVNSQDWFLHLCTLEGKECEFIARKKTNQKSRKEEKYYWAVVVKMIADECGYTSEKAHGVLQYKFFRYKDEKGNYYIKSTKLNQWITQNWEAKMSEIRQWASEFLGIFIPKPNEVEMY